MKLTPANKKFLTFMASGYGRLIRLVVGGSLIAIALTQLGWALLLLPLGIAMTYTGIANVCPVGPLFRQSAKSAELLKSLQSYDLK